MRPGHDSLVVPRLDVACTQPARPPPSRSRLSLPRLRGRAAACVYLPQCLVEADAYADGKVERADVLLLDGHPHDPTATHGHPGGFQRLWRQTHGLTAEEQPVARAEEPLLRPRTRAHSGAPLAECDKAFGPRLPGEERRESSPTRMGLRMHERPVVKPRAPEPAVIDGESQRLHEVKRAASRGASPSH